MKHETWRTGKKWGSLCSRIRCGTKWINFHGHTAYQRDQWVFVMSVPETCSCPYHPFASTYKWKNIYIYSYIWSEGLLFLCGLEVWGINIPMSRRQPKTNGREYINITNFSPLGWDKSEACVLHHFPDSPSWIKLQLPRWELLDNTHLIVSTHSMSYFLIVLVFPRIISQINELYSNPCLKACFWGTPLRKPLICRKYLSNTSFEPLELLS